MICRLDFMSNRPEQPTVWQESKFYITGFVPPSETRLGLSMRHLLELIESGTHSTDCPCGKKKTAPEWCVKMSPSYSSDRKAVVWHKFPGCRANRTQKVERK